MHNAQTTIWKITLPKHVGNPGEGYKIKEKTAIYKIRLQRHKYSSLQQNPNVNETYLVIILCQYLLR